ncbi:single-stranded-DNA-specific exonuclease RecJ [Chthonomonas calidirosea]|uniref:Single-stranded-DNA-specific exonuclease RecJ n=1 Tax=Chthonomonas calidirosea (strain DSM 23976 / ICMP 18418 / T49) TaxID=1303518 RepID=S0EZP0_CHTCT|nr:single-stranded-DNA-specific exonuclease RecJ [Chthonomonas calidirosea]CCW35964.1 single-stranded-DNA-specific exonuclease RecJ [Chthonomonas calidirosea T49]CEK18728.1 single-stranded-DNA-specific exonuclease RecJ [Chthonomonas calidirosea]
MASPLIRSGMNADLGGTVRWRVLPPQPAIEQRLLKGGDLHPIVARLLAQRGIETVEEAHRFLHPHLDHLHDPFLLPDVEPACVRIQQALHRHERILVYGDYDSDGVTSAALWTRLLRRLGAEVEVFVPHRKRDGYDIRHAAIAQAKARGVRLIITTDCGVRRVEEVEYARQLGIDVIITDHHLPPEVLPRAVAVVNPHRADSRYPFPYLAGVGVAFRCGEALVRHLGLKVESYRQAFLDLVTIGTITDLMPLLDENRVLVTFGLQQLPYTKKPGLQALLEVSGVQKPQAEENAPLLTVRDIGFSLGPRLNAASRVDETKPALDLLLTSDPGEARRLAALLDAQNRTRQEEQKRIFQEAIQRVQQEGLHERACIIIKGTGWSSGIIGLVAGKLTEAFHRPSIVLALNPQTGEGRGSARSIEAFDLGEALELCRPLLIDGGGHAHAAGFSIRLENVADLTQRMEEIARQRLTEEDLQPVLDIDAELSPHQIDERLLEQLEGMAPFGMENPEPIFVSYGAFVRSIRPIGKEFQHLKLIVAAQTSHEPTTYPALMWWQGTLASELAPGPADICYRLQRNTYQGERRIQLLVEDIRQGNR